MLANIREKISKKSDSSKSYVIPRDSGLVKYHLSNNETCNIHQLGSKLKSIFIKPNSKVMEDLIKSGYEQELLKAGYTAEMFIYIKDSKSPFEASGDQLTVDQRLVLYTGKNNTLLDIHELYDVWDEYDIYDCHDLLEDFIRHHYYLGFIADSESDSDVPQEKESQFETDVPPKKRKKRRSYICYESSPAMKAKKKRKNVSLNLFSFIVLYCLLHIQSCENILKTLIGNVEVSLYL